jgi:IMP dehydrogenase
MQDINITNSLTFDDILLRPKYSDIESRSEVNLSVHIDKLDVDLKHPIIPANMKTIIEFDMAKAIYLSGGMAFIHRFMPVIDQLSIVQKLVSEFGDSVWKQIGLSVGVKSEDYAAVDEFVGGGARLLNVDIAHGHSKLCIDMCENISKKYPNVFLVGGNVATFTGAKALFKAGVDACKGSIGGGSLCTTRIMTGNGMPTMSAIIEMTMARDIFMRSLDGTNDTRRRYVIADGGIRSSGDLVKTLCFTDLAMVGNMLAGCDECPSEAVVEGGKTYRRYVGSSTHKSNHIEGVEALVPSKGSVNDVLRTILENVRSGCSYQGARNLNDLRKNPSFARLTNASMIESHPHDVKVVK